MGAVNSGECPADLLRVLLNSWQKVMHLCFAESYVRMVDGANPFTKNSLASTSNLARSTQISVQATCVSISLAVETLIGSFVVQEIKETGDYVKCD